MKTYETMQDGFKIQAYAIPEIESYIDVYGDDEQSREIEKKIESGELEYFVAVVKALRHEIVLGTAILGGCVYEDIQDFINEPGYYQDLVEAAISEAKDTLILLQTA